MKNGPYEQVLAEKLRGWLKDEGMELKDDIEVAYLGRGSIHAKLYAKAKKANHGIIYYIHIQWDGKECQVVGIEQRSYLDIKGLDTLPKVVRFLALTNKGGK